MKLVDWLLLLGIALAYTAASLTPYPDVQQGREGIVTGEASWFDDGPGLYAAVHSYRFGDPRYSVRVCRADDADVCVTVTVRDHMANRVRAIDLSADSFARLAPLAVGVIRVTVERVNPGPTLPPTDTGFGLTLYHETHGAGSSGIESRLLPCLVTDDSVTAVYEGSLAPGETYETAFDWCAFSDVVMEPDGRWEGTFEALAVELVGRGSLALEVLEDTFPLVVQRLSAAKGYSAFQGCATYHERVALTGDADGSTTIRVTNTGTKTARDLSMAVNIGTERSGFLEAHCGVAP